MQTYRKQGREGGREETPTVPEELVMGKVRRNERVSRRVGGEGGHVGVGHCSENAEGEDGVRHVHRAAGGGSKAEV